MFFFLKTSPILCFPYSPAHCCNRHHTSSPTGRAFSTQLRPILFIGYRPSSLVKTHGNNPPYHLSHWTAKHEMITGFRITTEIATWSPATSFSAYYSIHKLLSLLIFFIFDHLSYSKNFKKYHIFCYDLFY
jgi:hypothetical protein